MTVSAPASDDVALVTLKSGLVVSLEALQLAWSLEDRGATLEIDGADLVVDTPPDVLTAADRDAIRRWRTHLIAMIAYRPPAT